MVLVGLHDGDATLVVDVHGDDGGICGGRPNACG